MNLDQELETRLAALTKQGLRRALRRVDSTQGTRIQVGGKTLLNFSSNDYLGLANHPALKEAAIHAIEKFGVGAGASRLICGSLAPHHELEEALAAFKGTEAALSFSSGYATAVGTICALMGKDDIIILDKLGHACIVDAAKLSGAKIRVFKHNNLDDLERILKWAAAESRHSSLVTRHVMIVTESVFSMDGDSAPLRELVELKERYGAWLMVDEAHATGLYGERGQGLASQLGVADRIELQMGTLGKALGVSGGYIAGSRKLVDYLINRARSFVFSTAPPPAVVAAVTKAVHLAQSLEGANLREELWARVALLRATWIPLKFALPKERHPILPLLVGEERAAIALADALRDYGIFVPAVRYPTVARGAARLRFTTTAAHSEDDHLSVLRAILAIRRRKAE